jgi:hypothetical protein
MKISGQTICGTLGVSAVLAIGGQSAAAAPPPPARPSLECTLALSLVRDYALAEKKAGHAWAMFDVDDDFADSPVTSPRSWRVDPPARSLAIAFKKSPPASVVKACPSVRAFLIENAIPHAGDSGFKEGHDDAFAISLPVMGMGGRDALIYSEHSFWNGHRGAGIGWVLHLRLKHGRWRTSSGFVGSIT